MTTSGVSTGLMTAGDVVRTAYEVRGAVSIEGDVTGSQMDFGLKQLNWMLKSQPFVGLNDFRISDVEITWPADTPEAELNSNYLDILSLRYEDTRPLERWTRDDVSAGISDKAQSGVPVMYATWRERDKLWLRLWPVPEAEVTLQADVERVAHDVTDPAETLDIQQEWTEAVIYTLATRLVGGTKEMVALVEMRAKELKADLGQFGQSGSLFLQPDLSYR